MPKIAKPGSPVREIDINNDYKYVVIRFNKFDENYNPLQAHKYFAEQLEGYKMTVISHRDHPNEIVIRKIAEAKPFIQVLLDLNYISHDEQTRLIKMIDNALACDNKDSVAKLTQ